MSQMRPRRAARHGVVVRHSGSPEAAYPARLALGLIGRRLATRRSGHVCWRVEGLGQGAMDGSEIEVALGHPRGGRVGTGGTYSRCEILERHRLEARLDGIVRDEFGAVPCDGRLALGIRRGCDDDEAAVVIAAALEHGRDKQLLAPELFDWRVAQGGCVGITEDTRGAR
jgi:hypothetical protein